MTDGQSIDQQAAWHKNLQLQAPQVCPSAVTLNSEHILDNSLLSNTQNAFRPD
jgi:hypothetical protein